MSQHHTNNLAVDFDGVVHDYKHPIEGRRMGAPIEGAKEAIRQLRKRYKIIIFSTWAGSDQGLRTILEWLKYYEIKVDAVTNIKPEAVAYIDDKAIRFTGDWGDAISKITNKNKRMESKFINFEQTESQLFFVREDGSKHEVVVGSEEATQLFEEVKKNRAELGLDGQAPAEAPAPADAPAQEPAPANAPVAPEAPVDAPVNPEAPADVPPADAPASDAPASDAPAQQ